MIDLKSMVIDSILKTKGWDNFARNVVGKIDFRFGEPRIHPSDYYSFCDILDPNKLYAFACAEMDRPSYYLEKYLFKAEYSHAGLILPSSDARKHIGFHIDTEGLHEDLLLDLIAKTDRYCIIELPITLENLHIALSRVDAIRARKPHYDTAFDLLDHSRVFCSEIVYEVGFNLIDDPDFKIVWEGKKATFNPDIIPLLGKVVSKK